MVLERIKKTCLLLSCMLAVAPAFGQSGAKIHVTPVAPANALVFRPNERIAVQFRLANNAGKAAVATLAARTFGGAEVLGPVDEKVAAAGETTLKFKLGKSAAGFYRLDLKVSAGTEALYQESFPLAVHEEPEPKRLPPAFPVGVYINSVKHLQGRGAVYLNTYAHAMANDLSGRGFNTVVTGAPFGAEQIAVLAAYGLATLLRDPAEELLGLDSVIGGILAENPRTEDVVPLMQKHLELKAKVKKPLMIGVNGELAGTNLPGNPTDVWWVIWEKLKEDAAKLAEIRPYVMRYWQYSPIEYGPPYPILQSYACHGNLSFMDSLAQAASPLHFLPAIRRLEDAEEQAAREKAQKGEAEGEAEDDAAKKKAKKEPPLTLHEYFGQIPLWVKLQASGTTRAQSPYRVPTPAELQTMMHLSLAQAVKGIMLDCYQTDRPGTSGMVDPVSLQPTDGRLDAAGKVARLVAAHDDIFPVCHSQGLRMRYSNAFVAPLAISTGSKRDDNLRTYVYITNLNTKGPASTWLYDLPRMLRDVVTGKELCTEMYEMRGEAWWGLFMTLQPGEARVLETVDLLPTVHQ